MMPRRDAAGPRWRNVTVTGEKPGDAGLGGAGPQDAEPALVPDRSCGTCSLCCKVYSVKELEKPAGRWCVHSVKGGGCGIHLDRPHVCRQFFCSWRFDPNLGPEWKPEVSRFVLSADPAWQALVVMVDPDRPLAWKRAPYYAMLKKFSEVFFRINQKVLVNLRGHITVLLPDCEVPIGHMTPGEEIVLWRDGPNYCAALRRNLEPVKAPSASVGSGSM
jgi:hypothetical protein